jgi:hypothetical protein
MLTDLAKEHEVMFVDLGLFSRSEEKFDKEGLRTVKKLLSYNTWVEMRRNFGKEFLISTYCGGQYCVVTTPTHQYGMLTEELKESDKLKRIHKRGANMFTTEVGPSGMTHTTGPKLTPVPDETTDGQHQTSSD